MATSKKIALLATGAAAALVIFIFALEVNMMMAALGSRSEFIERMFSGLMFGSFVLFLGLVYNTAKQAAKHLDATGR